MVNEQLVAPTALLTTINVADFDIWLGYFAKGQTDREAAGFLGHHLNQAENDPNTVTAFLPCVDIDRAKTFLSSPNLKAHLTDAGVIGAPVIRWLEPARIQLAEQQAAPAAIISHTVADFDQWLASYDADAGLRAANGIIGQAASRSLDDANTVIVYHQAQDFETLRNFLTNPDLIAAVKRAGATSPPEINYFLGGWGAMY